MLFTSYMRFYQKPVAQSKATLTLSVSVLLTFPVQHKNLVDFIYRKLLAKRYIVIIFKSVMSFSMFCISVILNNDVKLKLFLRMQAF